MQRLVMLTALLLFGPPALAQAAPIQCPGESTVEMRYCAAVSLEDSNNLLQQKIPQALFQQWQDATRAVCTHAHRPFREGTIYPQLVVGCDDNLNRALLREFEPLNNQGEPERTP
jgi:hypothetical protein